MSDPALSRRKFLQQASAGALALGAARPAAPATQPRGADDRLVLAVIGTGGMGGGDVGQLLEMETRENIRLAAVCDVFRERAKANAARCKGEAYEDYRKLLERKDL